MAVTLHRYKVGNSELTIAGIAEDADDDAFDPNFFDEGYSLAAQTAYSVWEGAAFLLAFLQRSDEPCAVTLRVLLGAVLPSRPHQLTIGTNDAAQPVVQLLPPQRIVELGSGTGAAGLGLALLGCQVLLTDVAPVVESMRNNIASNAQPYPSPASPFGPLVSSVVADAPPATSWMPDARAVGAGWAAAQSLNWMFPLSAQRSPADPCAARVVLATETTWLRELVDPFVGMTAVLLASPLTSAVIHPDELPTTTAGTVQTDEHAIFAHLRAHPWLKWALWVYKERGTATSDTFTTFAGVTATFASAGCRVYTVYREASSEDPGQDVRINVVVSASACGDVVVAGAC
ncbi:hypothetical protein BC828DRAFT_384353 [Blastocladiella britannica]|nr:hypothetical protein BC828DRAFT_384353 [Blastocladiella britannica]